MRVKWTRRAIRALDDLADHIAQDRPMASRRVIERIHESVSHLTDHPLIGRQGRVPGTRELVVPGTSVILPYRLQGETIEILHVFHTARRWPTTF